MNTTISHDRTGIDIGNPVGCRIGFDSGFPGSQPTGPAMDRGLVAGSACGCQAGDEAARRGGSGRRALNLQRVTDAFAAAVVAAELSMTHLHADRMNPRRIARCVRDLRRCGRLRGQLETLLETGRL
jgi:hypothetical protein